MLASVIAYGLSQDTFDLVEATQSSSDWIFLGFVAAFAVKAPIFPLHGWLPDAYREAPPEVAAMFSGVVPRRPSTASSDLLAKFPEPFDDYRTLILILASAGLVYGSILAFRAPDLRGVIAYSSSRRWR